NSGDFGGNAMNQNMQICKRRKLILSAALATVGVGSIAHGTTYTYNPAATDSTWSHDTNWLGNVAPPSTPAAGDTTDILISGDLHTQASLAQDRPDDTIDSFTILPYSNTST